MRADTYRDLFNSIGLYPKVEKTNYRLLFYSESVNDSSYRYRVSNLGGALKSVFGLEVQCIDKRHSDLFEAYARHARILVIHRAGISSEVIRLIELFRGMGKKVIFDTDDLVIHPDNTLELIDALGVSMTDYASLDYWYAYIGRMSATVAMCDHVTATTDEIAEFVVKQHKMPATVIRNFPSESQFTVSKSTLPKSERRSDLPIKLGYFSGSPSHSKDFALIEYALGEILENNNVHLSLAGYLDSETLSKGLPKQVTKLPYVPYDQLINLISKVDINLAPLKQSRFTDSKSALKLFDAALAGTYSLASPSREYVHFNNKIQIATIVKNDDWLGALQALLTNETPNVDFPRAQEEVLRLAYSETKALLDLALSLS